LTIFAQALAPIVYASSGENLQPHPVPKIVSDRKSRFLFFILAWGRRSKTLEGEPWFVAADVCRALGLGNSSDVIKRLDEDERTLVSIEGASNGLPVNAVNEPGLYALILGSRKPEAKAFKRWITHEVIPRPAGNTVDSADGIRGHYC
jgi:hypothetical protein